MKYLVLLLVAVSTISAYKDEMLDSNRIPTNTDDVTLGDTCGECKSMVKRFIEAIDDPTKLAELKMLLSALCHETSYAEECKLIVSKIDVIIKKLEPYLRDAEAVCKKMHLCSNPKLTSFHRIGLLYLKHGMGKVDGKNCTSFEACDSSTAITINQMSKEEMESMKCDACIAFSAFMEYEIDQPDFKTDLVAGLNYYVCSMLRDFSAFCENLTMSYVPKFVDSVISLLKSNTLCGEIAHVC